jgi:hypothetical protein
MLGGVKSAQAFRHSFQARPQPRFFIEKKWFRLLFPTVRNVNFQAP